MRTQILDLPKQVVLTNDNVSFELDCVVYYRYIDPIKVTYKINDQTYAIKEITISAMRETCGLHTFQ